MRTLLFLFCFLFFLPTSHSQKFLQIEKSGRMKVRRVYMGESFYFRLKGEQQWYNKSIQEIHVGAGIIQFENYAVNINEISAVKFSSRDGHWARRGSSTLYAFAGSWVAWSLLGTLDEGKLGKDTVTVPLGAVALGTLVRVIFRPSVFKIKKRRRLRLLDLNFKDL